MSGIASVVLMVGSAVAEDPTANEIVLRMMARNAERQAALEHYAGERTYRVEYRGTGGYHAAEMRVDLDYVNGQKHFSVVSETGSKLICEKVLRKLIVSEAEASEGPNRMQMTLSPENYRLELVGREVSDGVNAWVLQVSPKVESKFTYRGRVWVSEYDYAVVRVVGEPAKNPSWWISRASFDWRYARNGGFWLPERNVAKSHVRIGGDATLTIDYGSYRIFAAREVEREDESGSVVRSNTALLAAPGTAREGGLEGAAGLSI
jgi:hypothetical protein